MQNDTLINISEIKQIKINVRKFNLFQQYNFLC